MHELFCVCAPAFKHEICGSKCQNFISMLKTINEKYSHKFQVKTSKVNQYFQQPQQTDQEHNDSLFVNIYHAVFYYSFLLCKHRDVLLSDDHSEFSPFSRLMNGFRNGTNTTPFTSLSAYLAPELHLP